MQSLERFGRIFECQPDDPGTWQDRIFLTLDMDWAHDDVIAEAADMLERADVAATWFVTHETPMLERLRANPRFELGIHPNFNFLLDQGDGRTGSTAEEVVDRLLALVPEARSVRSHAMAQSSNLMALFARKGLTHDANHFVPEQSGIPLKPWWHWCGIVKVPHFWEDDVYCLSPANSPMEELVARGGLAVFDFHPVHIFLNTEDMGRYETSRPWHQDPARLFEARNRTAPGTRDRLLELLDIGTAGARPLRPTAPA